MKLSIKRSTLNNTLRLVLPAVGKSTLPVLEYVRFSTDGSLVRVSATNLEYGITANAIAQIEEPGEICIPAKIFSELISIGIGEDVHLSADNGKLVINSGKSNNTLNILPADEFPPMTPFAWEGSELNAEHFIGAIQKTVFCASKDDNRPTFQGILVQRAGNDLVLAATDGFRLSVKSIPISGELEGLIPAHALNLVAKMAKGEETIKTRQEYGRIVFTGAGWQLETLLIDGKFPDYKTIVPRDTKTKIAVSAAQLLTALKQVKIMGNGYVELHANGNLTVHGEDEGNGKTETVLDAQIDGPEQTIYFNTEYLSEAVSVIGGTVELKLGSHQTPAILHGSDPFFEHVLMPVHRGK